MKNVAHLTLSSLLLFTLLLTANVAAQEQQPREPEEEAYGSKFFEQLRTIFGRFRDSDLQRVFNEAKPIDCSELVGRKGEWRPVAFFNEDRTLGAWFRESLEEVKAGMAVYAFKGTCGGERPEIQVETEFPTLASLEDYRTRKIGLDQVDITVNEPVTAVQDPGTKAYKFDLPYLFLREDAAPRKVYSLTAPDRDAAYASDVASRWECKGVSSADVTYRFLICRVNTVPHGKLRKGESWEPTFGSSAFFVLSDGTETHTKVNLTFGDPAGSGQPEHEANTNDTAATPTNPPRPTLKRK